MDLNGDGPNVTTPAASGPLLFSVSDIGNLLCISPAEGKVRWKIEIGETQSSPTVAGHCLFTVNAKGLLRAYDISGAEPVLLGTLDLGEPVRASPALAQHRLYIRGEHRLYAISAAH